MAKPVQEKALYTVREQCPVREQCQFCGETALAGDGLVHGPQECYWASHKAFQRWMDLHDDGGPAGDASVLVGLEDLVGHDDA